MQRVLQAGARAGCAARSKSAERSAVQSIGEAAASSKAAPVGRALLLPAGSPDEHVAAHLGQRCHSAAATAAMAPGQTPGRLGSLGDPFAFTRLDLAVTWSSCPDTHTSSLASARQHILSPLGASFGRPASFASTAQAACQPQPQPFAVRQASNERPGLHRQPRAASAEERAAIVARLASSLEERGFVSSDTSEEGFAQQNRSCREVGDSMVAAMEQGAPAQALSLFEPGLLIKRISCNSPMQEGGLAAADMCDALLRACAALGEVALMLQAVRAMHALAIPVGYVAHGSVLSGLGRADRLEEALQYLRNEVPPKARTAPMYNSLLEAAQHSGKPALAQQALQLMEEAGVAPDSRTVCAALRLLVVDFAAQGGRRQAGAVHIYWAKLDPALKPHVTVRAAYVAALCMSAGPHEALRALEDMLQLFAALHCSQPMSAAAAQHPVLEGNPSAPHDHALQGSGVQPGRTSETDAVLEAPRGSLQQGNASMRGSSDDQPLSSKARALSSSPAAAAEPTWAAHRAAQAACQQVLNAAARAGLPDLAQGILQAMHQAGVQPDTAIYNSIMRQQAAAGMGPDVLETTLSDMEAQGLIPDRRSLFLLLRAYGRGGDLGGAMSVMRRMAQLGIVPDCFTYNALLEAHAAAHDLEGVASVYKAMLGCGVKPDICTFVALFQSLKGAVGTAGLMRSEPGQASWLQRMRGTAFVAPHELLNAWREDFDSSGLRHTPASFTALVQALGQTQQIEDMLELLSEAWAGQAAPRPSIYACNSAVSACARTGRLDEALRLCSTMEREGLQADTYTYSLLMNGYAHASQPDMASKLFDQMHERGVRVNAYIYNALIKAQASTGDIGQALHVFDAMLDAGLRPDGATWQILLSQSKYLGRHDVAELVLQRMQGRIQQWPQHILQEGGLSMYEGNLQVDAAANKQEPSQEQPSWYKEIEEDEDDDILGGPRF